MHEGPLELDRIIRRPELLRVTGLSAATIFRLIRRSEFPAPVELSRNARGWKASHVQAWLERLRTPEAGPGGEIQGKPVESRPGGRFEPEAGERPATSTSSQSARRGGASGDARR
jgi:prophage regulatory protein